MTMHSEALGDSPSISNELELPLPNGGAETVISELIKRIEATPEVNPEHMVEVMGSMAHDSGELNAMVTFVLRELVRVVESLKLQVHGGSSLYRDVSRIEPRRYRTTSLSETLARGLLEISSQQLVIGVARDGKDGGETFAIQLYNCLRQVTPVLLALSASSPYRYQQARLVDTGFQSRRPSHYRQMSRYLPPEMFATPQLSSVAEYHDRRWMISQKVRHALLAGDLDHNETELYRDRDGHSYAPFDLLAPHQLYGWVRLRPDHANEDSLLSIEVRVCDMPIRVETVQTLNSFIAGLVYYASRHGFDEIQNILQPLQLADHDATNESVLIASRTGLDTILGIGNHRTRLRSIAAQLTNFSILGLQHRGLDTEQLSHEMNRILTNGNDAQLLRNVMRDTPMTPVQLEQFLATMLYQSVMNER